MARYYFHVRKGDILIKDPDGSEVAQTESLEEEAVEAAQDLLAEGTSKAWTGASGCMRSPTRAAIRFWSFGSKTPLNRTYPTQKGGSFCFIRCPKGVKPAVRTVSSAK